MTAQEKAKELVGKLTYARHDDHEKYVAKQCALIAVDEIINVIKQTSAAISLNYWEQVNAEIEKL